MEIEYLYEFTVIAKMQNFSRAAEELCMSQSSLSKHVLALERELGVPLLIRNSRNVTLSPAGAQILPLAAQASELKNKIRVVADKQSGREKTNFEHRIYPCHGSIQYYRVAGQVSAGTSPGDAGGHGKRAAGNRNLAGEWKKRTGILPPGPGE